MEKLRFLLIIGMAILGCSTSSVQKEQAALNLQIGTSHLAKGRYPQAMFYLLEAQKLSPDDPVISNNLGLVYFVKKEFNEALPYFQRAIKLDGTYTDAKNNCGRTLVELNRADEAITVLTDAIADVTYSTPEKAYANLGLAYIRKGNLQDAVKMLNKSIASNNKFCTGYNYYGQALFQMGKYSAASEAFENALQLCENRYDEAHYYSALSYFKNGQKEKAEGRFKEVIRLYPQSEFAGKAKDMLKTIK